MASTTSLPPLEATPLRSEPACRRKPVVLTLITSLWPGNDASGWNISIAALAEALQDEFEFLAVSRDRPFGAPAPSATSEDEAAEFERGFPYARRIAVAPDFGMPLEPLAHRSAPPGPLRIVFLGRVSRVKNLDLALRALAHVTAPVAFDIYGPLQDAA